LRITVDYRERVSGLLELIREHDVFVEVKPLPFCDYIINSSITIERKTARDFLISIIDGRLFTQLVAVEGIGMVSAKAIREVLDSEY
jgi:Fanconi anemia group M protein